MTATLCVLRYLKGCPGLGLFFSNDNQIVIKVFSDFDWRTCVDSRKSIIGYCVFLGKLFNFASLKNSLQCLDLLLNQNI